jgi:hypothetical protein
MIERERGPVMLRWQLTDLRDAWSRPPGSLSERACKADALRPLAVVRPEYLCGGS